MYKNFEVNRTKVKGGCQSYTKAAQWESWSDFTLIRTKLQHVSLPKQSFLLFFVFKSTTAARLDGCDGHWEHFTAI